MAEGYLDDEPQEWAAHFSDGHYLTSDLGRLADGFLVLEGRVGKILNLGGRKIDPGEIEEALRGIDGVSYACVLPVHVHGRPALAAFIESASLSRTDILRSLSGKLADYKIPSAIRVAAKLPRGDAGKVSRERLLAEFQEG
jgi:acyl-CoA synthetase (AMP-forming)/AMP-acid ligase II